MSSIGKVSEKNVNLSKGILYSFFVIFLLFYGIFLTDFVEVYQKNNPGSELPIFLTYIPLVCYVASAFVGLGLFIFIRKTTAQKSREIQSRKKAKTGSIYKNALFLIIFIFVFIPLFGSIFDQGVNDQNFSIYNDDWNI
ncbi:MAG: hypothetical protein ACTSR5_16450 [Promethearchaeota archaeon]